MAIHINPANRGKYTARAHSSGHSLGEQISKDLSPSSKASGTAKKEANFARMARRGWKPLPGGKKRPKVPAHGRS